MNNKTANPTIQPRRRWLNIGPGIVIALAISALIGSQYIKTGMANRSVNQASPIIERSVISSSYEDGSGPTPEVSYIITRSVAIKLTSAQKERLSTLQSEWEGLYAPKLAAANRAADDARKYLADAKFKTRVPVQQIEEQAGSVIALSREISSARRHYWDKAMRILDAQQRLTIQRERDSDWKKKKDALRAITAPK
ncbi:MAG: hypothetical protein ACYC1M_14295 [Armatimonadota bacterium]